MRRRDQRDDERLHKRTDNRSTFPVSTFHVTCYPVVDVDAVSATERPSNSRSYASAMRSQL